MDEPFPWPLLCVREDRDRPRLFWVFGTQRALEIAADLLFTDPEHLRVEPDGERARVTAGDSRVVLISPGP